MSLAGQHGAWTAGALDSRESLLHETMNSPDRFPRHLVLPVSALACFQWGSLKHHTQGRGPICVQCFAWLLADAMSLESKPKHFRNGGGRKL